jgi:zinc/manganese transport system permease protein
LVVTWLGLITAYYTPYPIGFYVSTFAFAGYVLARLGRLLADRVPRLTPAGVPA